MTLIEVQTSVATPQQQRNRARRSLLDLAPTIEATFESSSRAWSKHVRSASKTSKKAGRRSSKASTAVFLSLRENPRPADASERVLQLHCELNDLERAADTHATVLSAIERWTDLVVTEASTRGLRVGGRAFQYASVRFAEAEILNPEVPTTLMQKCDDLWLRAQTITDETAKELDFVASPISTDEQSVYRFAHTLEARLASDPASSDLKSEIQKLIEEKHWEPRLFQLRPLANNLSRAASAFADLELANDILSDAAEIFESYFEGEGSSVRSELGLDRDDATVAGLQLLELENGSGIEASLT